MASLIGFVFSATGPVSVLVLFAIWLHRRSASRGLRRVATAAAIFYVLAGIAIVPYAASGLLTRGYHQLRAEDVPPGTRAIVLLGGGDQFIQGWSDSITVTTPTEAERVLEAARVFNLIAPAWIISSGGQPEPLDRGAASAETMRDELVRLGIPAARILVESRSRSTRENATFAAAMLKPLAIDHIVLVTSGTHMRRSLGAFRVAGVDAIPAIARGGEPPSRWEDWLPSTRTLEWSGRVARETGGIGYYWLRGWWRR
jgi:uncharacterized SAM-binding protein YcdF (DUF218 family)